MIGDCNQAMRRFVIVVGSRQISLSLLALPLSFLSLLPTFLFSFLTYFSLPPFPLSYLNENSSVASQVQFVLGREYSMQYTKDGIVYLLRLVCFSTYLALLTLLLLDNMSCCHQTQVMLIVIGIQFFSIGLLGELITRSNQDNENRVKSKYDKI